MSLIPLQFIPQTWAARLIDAKEDRLVAYTLDAAAVRKRATAGDTMQCTQKAEWHVV